MKGDKKKAIELYRDLAKSEANTSFIYNSYVNVLIDMGMFDEAQYFLKKISKHDPQNIQYKLDMGVTILRSGDAPKA
ncbi:MAG: hypothetical protein ABJA70_02445, partial [Chryseolinea sp.]